MRRMQQHVCANSLDKSNYGPNWATKHILRHEQNAANSQICIENDKPEFIHNSIHDNYKMMDVFLPGICSEIISATRTDIFVFVQHRAQTHAQLHKTAGENTYNCIDKIEKLFV